MASIVKFIPPPPSDESGSKAPPEIKILNISMIASSLRRLEFYDKDLF